MATLHVYDLIDEQWCHSLNALGLGAVHVGLFLACVGFELTYCSGDGVVAMDERSAEHPYNHAVHLTSPQPLTYSRVSGAVDHIITEGWQPDAYSIPRGYCCVTFVARLCWHLGLQGLPLYCISGAYLAWATGAPVSNLSLSVANVASSIGGRTTAPVTRTFEQVMKATKKRKAEDHEEERLAKCRRHGVTGRRWGYVANVDPQLFNLLKEMVAKRKVSRMEVMAFFGITSEHVARDLIAKAQREILQAQTCGLTWKCQATCDYDFRQVTALLNLVAKHVQWNYSYCFLFLAAKHARRIGAKCQPVLAFVW